MRYFCFLVCMIAISGCGKIYNPQTISEIEGKDTDGLERRVERFSGPDKYGVVCYQDRFSRDNLSCVKVQP